MFQTSYCLNGLSSHDRRQFRGMFYSTLVFGCAQHTGYRASVRWRVIRLWLVICTLFAAKSRFVKHSRSSHVPNSSHVFLDRQRLCKGSHSSSTSITVGMPLPCSPYESCQLWAPLFVQVIDCLELNLALDMSTCDGTISVRHMLSLTYPWRFLAFFYLLSEALSSPPTLYS